MRKLIAFSSVFAAIAASAAPVVSNVSMTQAGGTVTIGYTLSGEPGIVTVDIQTNNTARGEWESIGGERLVFFGGDVNRRVEPGARTITWKPRKAWPDNMSSKNAKAVVSAWATNAPPDYMVVSLVATNTLFFYTCAESVPGGVTNDLYKTECLVMRKCPAANVLWRMGSPTTEPNRKASEAPHVVSLADDYYIGVYPVTQRQYELMMDAVGANESARRPSGFKLDSDYATRPVERVSYDMLRGAASDEIVWPDTGHAVKQNTFLYSVRRHTGLDGFDLPTEAQWEFACRAGCGTAYYNGENVASALDSLGRYRLNGGYADGATESSTVVATCTADNGTAKVGTYLPNAWGIYDMLGNVQEWCLDWYQDSLGDVSPATGPASGSNRVYRGGGWGWSAADCRSASRASNSPTTVWPKIGFRLVAPAGIP